MITLETAQLAYWLRKASEAHHIYEQGALNGRKDDEWPLWYARYIDRKLKNRQASTDTKDTQPDRRNQT